MNSEQVSKTLKMLMFIEQFFMESDDGNAEHGGLAQHCKF